MLLWYLLPVHAIGSNKVCLLNKTCKVLWVELEIEAVGWNRVSLIFLENMAHVSTFTQFTEVVANEVTSLDVLGYQ